MAQASKRSLLVRGLDGWGAIWLSTMAIIGGVWYLLRDVAKWIVRAARN